MQISKSFYSDNLSLSLAKDSFITKINRWAKQHPRYRYRIAIPITNSYGATIGAVITYEKPE